MLGHWAIKIQFFFKYFFEKTIPLARNVNMVNINFNNKGMSGCVLQAENHFNVPTCRWYAFYLTTQWPLALMHICYHSAPVLLKYAGFYQQVWQASRLHMFTVHLSLPSLYML